MKQILATLALAMLMGGSATAATVHGVKVSKNGLWVRIPNGTGIYTKPPQHDAIGLGEQPMAPVESRAQSLMARQRRAANRSACRALDRRAGRSSRA